MYFLHKNRLTNLQLLKLATLWFIAHANLNSTNGENISLEQIFMKAVFPHNSALNMPINKISIVCKVFVSKKYFINIKKSRKIISLLIKKYY